LSWNGIIGNALDTRHIAVYHEGPSRASFRGSRHFSTLCREAHLWVRKTRAHQLWELMGMERRLAAIFSTDVQEDSRRVGTFQGDSRSATARRNYA
jgi:hypothetical protein